MNRGSNTEWPMAGAPTEEHTLFTTRGASTGEGAGLFAVSQRPALLVQRGPTVGDWFPFPEDADSIEVGRGEVATFQVKDASVSRCHARFTLVRHEAAPLEVFVEDLGSTNGTRVGGEMAEGKVKIADGDLIRIGDVVLRFRLMDSADVAFQEDISRQVRNARKDTLTRLYSRRYMDEQLPGLMKAHRRNKQVMSLLIIDLDHFKAINDNHGHLVGDEVLWRVAESVRATVRTADSAVRYGGEEFCVILPGTDRPEAARVGERLREAVGKLNLDSLSPGLTVTASIGVAALEEEEELHEWLQRADLALYAAKHAGRNQVRIAPPTAPTDPQERTDPTPVVETLQRPTVQVKKNKKK
ncbi:MAG: GGDEF domain-containing protein [Proteobacteria bacterium]|nr:GGDEF domain-containing protein [Pseudomonadota bacterium]